MVLLMTMIMSYKDLKLITKLRCIENIFVYAIVLERFLGIMETRLKLAILDNAVEFQGVLNMTYWSLFQHL